MTKYRVGRVEDGQAVLERDDEEDNPFPYWCDLSDNLDEGFWSEMSFHRFMHTDRFRDMELTEYEEFLLESG